MPDFRSQARRGLRRTILGLGSVLGLGLVALQLPGASSTADAAGVCQPAPAHLATAATEPIGGIGGTGRSVDPRDPGAGGIGGTGIVGTITGFASICVNGVEVHYDAAVPVSENGRAASVSALAVGQVVALEAAPQKPGLTARRIEIVHALEGPVTRNESGRLEVMGAAVLPADATQAAGAVGLRAGEWVQVSGHRDEAGQWVATRVARVSPRAEATLQGSADGDGRFAGVRIGSETTLAAGATHLVRGTWQPGAGAEAGRLRVRESAPSPAVQVVERADHVIIETRVREVRGDKVKSGHPEFDAALSGRALREGELVRIRGVRGSDGRFVADRLERQASRDAGGRSAPEPGKGDAARDRDGQDKQQRSDSDRDRRDDRGDDRDRNGRDRADRNDRNDRHDRSDRSDRPERIDRRNRD